MTDRLTELESTLRQIHADQGGEATFPDFVNAVADDPAEHGHEEAREYTGRLVIGGIKGILAEMNSQGEGQQEIYARNAQVDDFIHIKGQGKAVFKVTGRTQIDPPDNVEVKLVRDPHSEAHFKSGDVPGGEWVCLLRS